MVSVLFLGLSACNGPNSDRPTASTGTDGVRWIAELGPIAILTDPQGGQLHSHATAAWDGGDHYLVTWAAGYAPSTAALAAVYDHDGQAAGDAVALSPSGDNGDKPDVQWDGDRWVAGWNDSVGRVFLQAIGGDGLPIGGPSTIHDVDISADAMDLAISPDGSGVAIWTEFGASWMGEDGGRIVWQTFGADLSPVGIPKLADESSRKTSDAAPLPDGGWIGVWSRDYDHPVVAGDYLYEVWGRLYRGDGSAWTFRADDLDSAWPSRPAVDVREDGLIAVSWRDKTESDGAGLGSGGYGRMFDVDAAPLGPSIALGPDHNGDRVVVAWAGELAVFCWQETDPDGLPGLILSAVDSGSQQVVVDRLAVHEPGGDRDERPSIAVRPEGDRFEVLVTWETVEPGTGAGKGLRSRIVTLEPGS